MPNLSEFIDKYLDQDELDFIEKEVHSKQGRFIKDTRTNNFETNQALKDFLQGVEDKLNTTEGVTLSDTQKKSVLREIAFQMTRANEFTNAYLNDDNISHESIQQSLSQRTKLARVVLSNLPEAELGADNFNEKQALIKKIFNEEKEKYDAEIAGLLQIQIKRNLKAELFAEQGKKVEATGSTEDGPLNCDIKIFQKRSFAGVTSGVTGLIFGSLLDGEPMFKLPFEYHKDGTFKFHPSSKKDIFRLIKSLQVDGKVGKDFETEISFVDKQSMMYKNIPLTEYAAEKVPLIKMNIVLLHCAKYGMQDLVNKIKLDNGQPVLKNGFNVDDFKNAFENGDIKRETPQSLRKVIEKIQATIFSEDNVINFKVNDEKDMTGMDEIKDQIKEIYQIVRENHQNKIEYNASEAGKAAQKARIDEGDRPPPTARVI